jgi:hypothetical protein
MLTTRASGGTPSGSAVVEERLRRTIIARIRVDAVAPPPWIVRQKDAAVWVARAKPLDRFDPGRKIGELRSKERADDALTGELLPPALGLAIVHDKVRVPELASRAEAERAIADTPVEDDR